MTKCKECNGSGLTDNHVTGEIECMACEGAGDTGEMDAAPPAASADASDIRTALECARQAIEYSIDMGGTDPAGVLLQALNKTDRALTAPVAGADAEMRERCAKMATEYYKSSGSRELRNNYEQLVGEKIAAAIRALPASGEADPRRGGC